MCYICHNFKYHVFSLKNLFLPFVSKYLTKDLFFLKPPVPPILYV